MLASVFSLVLAAISLDGVVGKDLQARAELDALNVRVGDPVSLTVDFFGDADFSSIHPPALSKAVDAKTWRVDDASSKTETYRNARRLVYRLRPIKEGVIRFPSLAFTYDDAGTGEKATVTTGEIPVHVRPGSQVALSGLEDLRVELPQPDGLLIDLSVSPWASAANLSEDDLFAWRKACAAATAEAFAPFDFPEARLNEAACEIQAGNWAKALKIYSALEWRIGQIPTIERGIIAALALKTGNPSVELPMGRQVLRPILRYAAVGRVSIVLGVLLALGFLFWAIRRGVRALACVAVLLTAGTALALDPFAEIHRQMDEHMRAMDEQIRMTFGGGSPFGGGGMRMTINGREAPKVEIQPSVVPDRTGLTVGEPFNFILSLEMPKSCTVSDIRFSPSQVVGYSIVGRGERMTDGRTDNTNNVVRRIAIPVRYDAPFKGRVTFTVVGQWSSRIQSDNGFGGLWASSYSSTFQKTSPPIWMEVKPLSDENRPDDYSGAVGTSFRLTQQPDRTTVATNDVVALTCVLDYKGFLPPDAFPTAYQEADGRLVFRRYFVADGAPKTDELTLSYYDVTAKDYRRARCPGVKLNYVADEEEAPKTVVVNAAEGASSDGLLRLRFAPRESAAEIGTADPRVPSLRVTESHGIWRRVDDGRRAGWVKKEDLP